MQAILYSIGRARAAEFERVLADAGYRLAVCIVDGDGARAADVARASDCGIAFVDLALGTATAVALFAAIRGVEGPVPTLLAIIGEPEAADTDALIDAGANMYFPDDPRRLATRMRFLHGALERRMEFARMIRELNDAKARYSRIEREYRVLLERTPDAVGVHRGGLIVWINAALATLLGYANADEIVGKPVLELVPAGARAIAEQRLRDRAAGLDVPELELPIVRRDGSEFHALLIGLPSMFDGEPALVVYMRDLTERRRHEMQLTVADRMVSLGRLAASVGHEINNPLTYVIGNLDLAARAARKHGDASGDMVRLLEQALEGADRVQRIAEDLRVFAQHRSDDLAAIDAGTVIESCVRMTAGEIRHRARLVRAIDAVPRVLASEARLAQVITNLLLNAAQSMPDEPSEDHTITIAVREVPGDRVEIRIEDTGAGIAPEHLAQVFEPFFTTKGEVGGTGLGLSICKTLITSQGGELELDSELGRGTRVTLCLRIAERRPAVATPAASPTTVTRRRVLVIDDEVRVAELLRDQLKDHDVTIATCGRDGLALTATTRFDAIVCDLMMPELCGVDVHDRLRAAQPGLERKLVFITGGAFTPRATSFLSRVPNPCLDKPFAIDRLLEAIERAARL